MDAHRIARYGDGSLRVPQRHERDRTGVSKFANKERKHVLHRAAMNSVRYNQEMKTYFERKVGEGKSKIRVLNAVRNKLLHHIVAVVKRGTPYEIELN